jgi:hypothetical protein
MKAPFPGSSFSSSIDQGGAKGWNFVGFMLAASASELRSLLLPYSLVGS